MTSKFSLLLLSGGLLCCMTPGSSHAADAALPRRAWFGVALAPSEAGVSVTSVVPDSTAAAVGVAAADIISAIDGVPMKEPAAVVATMAAHRGGEKIAIDLQRKDKTLYFEPVLKSLPPETVPNSTASYDSVVTAEGYRLRTIFTLPLHANGAVPAVMLIQGGGCGSVDASMFLAGGQPGLMQTIAAAGYATMRVEKPGVGDSKGPGCDSIGYYEELNGYRAALAALRVNPAVDAKRIFLLGLSLGGVFAPVLARETPVAGIAAYGTIDFAPTPYAGRSQRFFDEFAAVDVSGNWRQIDVPVLLLHGEFDEGTQAAWHAHLASVIETTHPGRVDYRELPGLDHCWSAHASMEASRGHCGQGKASSLLSDTLLIFLRQQAPTTRG